MPKNSLLRTSAVSVALAATLATGALALGAAPAVAAPLERHRGTEPRPATDEPGVRKPWSGAGDTRHHRRPHHGGDDHRVHSAEHLAQRGAAPRAVHWVGIGLFVQPGRFDTDGYRTD